MLGVGGQAQGVCLHGDADQPGVRTLRVHELPDAVCLSRRRPTPTAQLPGPPRRVYFVTIDLDEGRHEVRPESAGCKARFRTGLPLGVYLRPP